jgi:hypothetical protein
MKLPQEYHLHPDFVCPKGSYTPVNGNGKMNPALNIEERLDSSLLPLLGKL